MERPRPASRDQSGCVVAGDRFDPQPATNTFFTPVNLFNILRAFSWIAVAAFGEMLVLIIGGIDLSVGAVMALSGMVSALPLQSDADVVITVKDRGNPPSSAGEM